MIETSTWCILVNTNSIKTKKESIKESFMKKRYQYWSKDGIVWTNWFNWDGPKLPSPFKKLKVEYNEEL